MKKVRIAAILLLILFSSASLIGCTVISGNNRIFFYERPAIGFTVEDEVMNEVDLEELSSLSLKAGNGVIRIMPYDGEKLQIIEKRKLTGPASKKELKTMLEKNRLTIEKDSMEIKLNDDLKEKQKPLFSLIIDIELKIPEAVKTADIVSKSGEIEVSGLKGKNNLNLEVDKGNITVENCEAVLILSTITNGNLSIGNSSGIGSYKCGRGNISLKNLKGNIELASLSGETEIDKADGRLKCDISTGSLTVVESHLSKDSNLYISYGDINADLSDLDAGGKVSVKASKGNIRLKLLENADWSLIAKSTKGKVTDNLGLDKGVLKTAPTGEVYGNVRGGGLLIDAYVDMGNIDLDKAVK